MSRRTTLAVYGMHEAQYEWLLDIQDNSCAICGTKDPGAGQKVFNVDHCHETGKVRGLLCFSCNNGLGKFKDNAELLDSAANYIRSEGLSDIFYTTNIPRKTRVYKDPEKRAKKLTWEKVDAIRQMSIDGMTQEVIGIKMHISQTVIGRIIRNELWPIEKRPIS